jgi:hypothetical protein
MNYLYILNVENLESIVARMNYRTSIDLSTDNSGETASISGFSFMRLLTLEPGCVGAGCATIFTSQHDFNLGGSVSNGASFTNAVDSPFAVSYDFGSPFSGPLRLDGGTLMTARAAGVPEPPVGVPEPSTIVLTTLGAIFCALRRRFAMNSRPLHILRVYGRPAFQ